MLAVIGGTGLTTIDCFEQLGFENVMTPYSRQPVTILLYGHDQGNIAFLPRHGKGHTVPPHKINYQANVWALNELGVKKILAINAVGGIHRTLSPGAFAIPNQIIDYTWGRESSFFDDDAAGVTHIDFTNPFDEALRQELISCLGQIKKESASLFPVLESGVYGCTQGPRLETAAEIQKLSRDGCDLVGMTAMPEAALARELDIHYAMLALSVNWGAGIAEGAISMKEIHSVLGSGMETVAEVLKKFASV